MIFTYVKKKKERKPSNVKALYLSYIHYLANKLLFKNSNNKIVHQ